MRVSFKVTVKERVNPLFDWNKNLIYKYYFKVPKLASNFTIFDLNGHGLAYDSARDGLFITGRSNDSPERGGERICEISIPTTQAANANYIQAFTEPSEGKVRQSDVVGSVTKMGAYIVQDEFLYGTYYGYYDATNKQKFSHWRRPKDLYVTGQVTDLVGLTANLQHSGLNPVRFTNNVIIPIPAKWQQRLGGTALVGGWCTNNSSGASNGPAAFVWNPAAISANQVVEPLLFYPYDHPINIWNTQSELWNGTTQQAGGFIFDDSLVFIYRQGIGFFCYGEGGAVPPINIPVGSVWCLDPDSSDHGPHAYPYVYKAMAYDINTLIADKATPWNARPYDSWTFTLPGLSKSGLNGVALDETGKRLFIEQARGDMNRPIIHVFEIRD